MSTVSNSEVSVPMAHARGLSPVQFAAAGAILGVLGISTIWFTMVSLWTLWTTDALKSIGMVVPLVSLVLILRAWRLIGWQSEGTWWGLALILITAAVERVQQQTILIMVVSPQWHTVLPPPSLMLLAYGSGVVLLLGGVRLYRAALFPILLLLFANPVPHVFSSLIDMPLQHVSAHVARAFAMSLGHSLTPDNLRLMFTPDFGMFIAPGCDGIRGSVTMGFIALIAGYIYGFRWYANALVVSGAVLLGYVFNLVRLCMLVLYYAVALHFPSLQNKAEMGDYVIGACLFLLATVLLFAVIHRLRDRKASHAATADLPPAAPGGNELRKPFLPLAALGVVVLLGGVGFMRARAATTPYAMGTALTTTAHFPANLGNYALVRSWNESLVTGQIVYLWAQYAPAGGGTPIAIGISPVLGWHDPLICHFTRGEQPLWHGEIEVATNDRVPVNFALSFYNDGATQSVEASTICDGSHCGEFATERTHFGFVYTHPAPKNLFDGNAGRPVPVMLRVETVDTTIPADVARQTLTRDLRSFLASVRLDDLTQPYSR